MDKQSQAVYDRIHASLHIDILEIDREVTELPMILQEAVELAAELKDYERQADHELDILTAKVSAKLRQVGDAKAPTESAIKLALAADPEIQKARDGLSQMSYDAELASGLVNTLRDKSRLVMKTADMIVSGFITPSSAYTRQRKELRKASQTDA
jgi:hypothetical protein